MKSILICLLTLLVTPFGLAEEFITSEPDSKSYHYVNAYRTTIDAPVETVWRQVIELGNWMDRFDMLHRAGEKGEVGEVLQLREGQETFIQITAMVENQLLAFANIPSTYNSEESTGSAFVTLVPTGDATVVSLNLNTRFTWLSDAPNFMKQKRESKEFQQQSDIMWRSFLARLDELSRAKTGTGT